MNKKYLLVKKIIKPKQGGLWWGSFDTLEEAKKALEKAQKKEPKEIFKIYVASYSEVE